jgi:hypothetical protein
LELASKYGHGDVVKVLSSILRVSQSSVIKTNTADQESKPPSKKGKKKRISAAHDEDGNHDNDESSG